MNKKKKYLLATAFAVLVLALVALYVTRRGAPSTPQGEQAPASSPTATEEPQRRQSKTSSYPGLTYTKAVNQYTDKRIQFDSLCRATPSSVTYKNGTDVMFDNRSAERLALTIDGRPYTLDSYEFMILTLRSQTLPHTTRIDCGSGKNNALILLQK